MGRGTRISSLPAQSPWREPDGRRGQGTGRGTLLQGRVRHQRMYNWKGRCNPRLHIIGLKIAILTGSTLRCPNLPVQLDVSLEGLKSGRRVWRRPSRFELYGSYDLYGPASDFVFDAGLWQRWFWNTEHRGAERDHDREGSDEADTRGGRWDDQRSWQVPKYLSYSHFTIALALTVIMTQKPFYSTETRMGSWTTQSLSGSSAHNKRTWFERLQSVMTPTMKLAGLKITISE